MQLREKFTGVKIFFIGLGDLSEFGSILWHVFVVGTDDCSFVERNKEITKLSEGFVASLPLVCNVWEEARYDSLGSFAVNVKQRIPSTPQGRTGQFDESLEKQEKKEKQWWNTLKRMSQTAIVNGCVPKHNEGTSLLPCTQREFCIWFENCVTPLFESRETFYGTMAGEQKLCSPWTSISEGRVVTGRLT